MVDALDQKYLENVHIEVLGASTLDSTNARGYFNVKASFGDTLLISYEGFLDQRLILNKDNFLFIELQDEARLLPTFQVDAKPYSFRFKDGKLSLVVEENKLVSSKGKVLAAPGTSLGGGMSIYGPISFFSKKARLARKYEAKLILEARKEGYYTIIESDSVKRELMDSFDLSKSDWNELVVRFNQINLHHQFLDWPSEKVFARLQEFILWEKQLLN